MTQRDVQRERTRTAIVRTAATMFDERGYLGTSIRDIAGALDLTVGAIFFHFKAKETLGREIVTGYYVRWNALVERARTRPGGRVEAMMWLSGRVAQAYVDDVEVRAAVRLVRDRSLSIETVPTPYLGWISITAEFLTQARAAGEVAPDLDVDLVAYQLVCTWFGNQHITGDLGALPTLPDRLKDMWRVFLPVFGGPTPIDIDRAFAA